MIRYLIIAHLALALFYGLYHFGLARLPFLRTNRILLLSLPILCLLLPLMDFSPYTPQLPHWEPTWEYQGHFEAGIEFTESEPDPVAVPWLSSLALIGLAYLFGIALALVLTLRLWWFSWQYLQAGIPAPEWGNRVYAHPQLPHSCTFWGRIYLGRDFHGLTEAQKDFLLRHEESHAHLRHGFDLVFLQIIKALFWCNPLIYRWVKQLQTLHEFQADRHAAPHRQDFRTYARLLLSLQMGQAPGVVSAFISHPLTERIMMLKKQNKAKFNWKPYLWLLPVLALALGLTAFVQSPQPLIEVVPMVEEPVVQAEQEHFQPISEDPYLPTLQPVSGQLTSGFGMRMHPILKQKRMHLGVDFKASMGTPVKAAGSGTVDRIDDNNDGEGYGKFITIDHGNGYFSLYAQLSEIKVKSGQKVSQGDVIALSGNSGASTAPHLHFEIKYQGKAVDPMGLLE